MPDDATESVATQLRAVCSTLKVWLHTARSCVATINHLYAPVTALMFRCSGTRIYDPEVRDEGSGQSGLQKFFVLFLFLFGFKKDQKKS